MLRKRNRLSRREFEALLKRGRRLHSDHVSIIYSFVSPCPTPYNLLRPSDAGGFGRTTPLHKAGVVVSKKVARKAVERNRLRRLVYQVLGEQCEALGGKHVAVLLKKGAGSMEVKGLREEIHTLLEKMIRSNRNS